MKKVTQYILPFCFGITILLPVLNSIFGIWHFDAFNENRVFAEPPIWNWQKLDNYPEDFDQWYVDHFSFRSPLLKIYHQSDFLKTHAPDNAKKSLEGKDGWFFLAGQAKDIYQNKIDFDKDKMDRMVDEWKRRQVYFDDRDIPFYWLLAPIKHYIYPEYLPFDFIRPDIPKRSEMIMDRLRDEIGDFIIDPTNEFLKAKDSIQVYYKTDTHWTEKGAFIAWKKVLDQFQKDAIDVKDFEDISFSWKDSSVVDGFHLMSLGLKGITEQTTRPIIQNQKFERVPKFGFDIPQNFSVPEKFELGFRNPELEDGLKVLIIRDSFCDALIPHLNAWFAESLIIFDAWHIGLNENIIEAYQPDLVLFLSMETQLDNIIR